MTFCRKNLKFPDLITFTLPFDTIFMWYRMQNTNLSNFFQLLHATMHDNILAKMIKLLMIWNFRHSHATIIIMLTLTPNIFIARGKNLLQNNILQSKFNNHYNYRLRISWKFSNIALIYTNENKVCVIINCALSWFLLELQNNTLLINYKWYICFCLHHMVKMKFDDK